MLWPGGCQRDLANGVLAAGLQMVSSAQPRKRGIGCTRGCMDGGGPTVGLTLATVWTGARLLG